MIRHCNGRHPPGLGPLHNIFYLRDAIHIAHLCVAVKLHPLYRTVVNPLAGKILIFFYPPHRANGQLPVKTINGSQSLQANKASCLRGLVHIL